MVFGAAGGFAASLNLSSLDGSNGFVLNGIDANDRSGNSVSSAGDVNGDGYDDLIIGARDADPNGSESGESYVIFGGPSLQAIQFNSLGAASFAENGTGVVRNIQASLNGGAADAGITYSITGGADAALFAIDGTTGELSFVAAPDFEAPGDAGADNIYNITVTAADTATGTDTTTQDLTITVTNVNEATAVTLPAAPVVAEDATNVAIADTVNIADVEGDSQTVTLTITGGSASVATTGLAFTTGDGTDDASMVFSGSLAAINSALDALTFTPTPDLNGAGAGAIQIQTDDGNGGTDDQTVTFDITAVNDAPTATDNTVVMNEDTSRTFTATDFNFADVDTGDTLASVRIDTLTVGSGTFRLSGVDVSAGDVIAAGDIGNLVYTPAADANGTGLLSFTFSVNDGTAFSAASSSFNVNVTDVFDPVPPVQIVVVADPANMSNQRLNGGSLGDRLGGGSGNDVISGGGGGDTLTGGAGNDFVAGGNGNDIVFAGLGDEGNDTVQGNLGNDIIGGGAGDDIIVGGTFSTGTSQFNTGDTGDDILFGGEGNDLLVAGSYNSATNTVVNTGQGNNILWAGGGNDTVFGDDEADTVGGGAGDDSVNAGGGDDAVFGGAGNDTVNAGAGNDSAFAGLGNDMLDGGDGDDLLFGGAGDDTVTGGAGEDEIWAGAGNDALSGGAGADTFVFGNTSGNDTVSDFNAAEDILNLAFASTDFTSLVDVTAAASEVTQNGQAGVLIDLGDSDSVFVIGISISDLTASNVSF